MILWNRSEDKRCSKCGSQFTYENDVIVKGKRYRYQVWRRDKQTGAQICGRCYSMYYRDNSKRQSKLRYIRIKDKRLNYRGKGFEIKRERVGVCNWCRAVVPFDVKQTHWHHDEGEYNDLDITKFIVEICTKCHWKESVRLKQVNMDNVRRSRFLYRQIPYKT